MEALEGALGSSPGDVKKVHQGASPFFFLLFSSVHNQSSAQCGWPTVFLFRLPSSARSDPALLIHLRSNYIYMGLPVKMDVQCLEQVFGCESRSRRDCKRVSLKPLEAVMSLPSGYAPIQRFSTA